jgi:hypothetical protein
MEVEMCSAVPNISLKMGQSVNRVLDALVNVP